MLQVVYVFVTLIFHK